MSRIMTMLRRDSDGSAVACARMPARLAAAAIAAITLTLIGPPPAQAQVVALVNGEPITALDVSQRMRLIQLSTRKQASRQEALDELIDDKLKVHISKRYIAEIPKREIDGAIAGIARRAAMTAAQFSQALAGSGISVSALKDKLKADFVWGQIIRGKFQASLQVGDKDVLSALGPDKKDDTTAFEYTLRPILLIVPRGAAPAVFEARRKEAEALRGRFQSCQDGVRLAMTMRDVAVRNPIIRLSSDLPAQQRAVLDGTPVGKLTPPDVTLQGVELFAVCRKENNTSDTPTKRELRDKMFNERYEQVSKRYLKELRRGAMIEIRKA